jgi:luciferase family oxidoreductase group 1
MSAVPFSLLDLTPIVEGGDAGQSLRNARDLARHAERWGYTRYWIAEHHNIPGVASAATSLVIGYIAEGTTSIRVGAGGIMLPNHAPLQIAEQFGTLDSLYPGRIDLGLGRAPGTDQATAHALRRTLVGGTERFPEDVIELMSYFQPVRPGQRVQAVPGAGHDIPIWILGSSLFGAELAALLGLPFAFASHFAPDALMQALALYRAKFRPSDRLAKPHVMVAHNVMAADTEAEARFLATSAQQSFANLRRGMPGRLPPPRETALGADELRMVEAVRVYSAIGTEAQVQDALAGFLDKTAADELIITGQCYDHAATLKSFEIAARAMSALNAR